MSAINALTSGTPAAAAGTSSRFTELSSEDFIKIIFTELQNQDPFKPNDSGALLEQLNSIRSIESDIQLSKDLESIVFQNQLATAGNLIGKRVAGLTAENERVGGTVKSVARNGDEIALVLENGWILPIDSVEFIESQPVTPGATPGGSTTGGATTGGSTSGSTTPPAGNPTNILSHWGSTTGGTTGGDMNGDGIVNGEDLALSLMH
jgi:flagellar basal-body rod modification protein FlgD